MPRISTGSRGHDSCNGVVHLLRHLLNNQSALVFLTLWSFKPKTGAKSLTKQRALSTEVISPQKRLIDKSKTHEHETLPEHNLSPIILH